RAELWSGATENPDILQFRENRRIFYPPWPAGSHVQLNGLSNDIEIFEGVVDLVDMGGAADQIRADFGLAVASVGDEIQLVGVSVNSGLYVVKSVSDTSMELTDLDGNDVTWLVPAERVLIRILRDDDYLGLYLLTDMSSYGLILRKLGDPNWQGFSTAAKQYGITAELIDGVIDPVSIGPFTSTPPGEV
ncbi:MAG: hypothetical protein RPR91_06290, partial [Colwellia sp.]